MKSKRTSLIILGLTSLACSRTMLVSFNDPEGPNLLIVTVFAAIVFALSLGVFFKVRTTGLKKLLLAIFTQIIIVLVLYFFLK